MNNATAPEIPMTTRTTDTGVELALVATTNTAALRLPECSLPSRGLLVCIECGVAVTPSQAPSTGRCRMCDGQLERRAV